MIEFNPHIIKKLKFKNGSKVFIFDSKGVVFPEPTDGIRFIDRGSEADGILFFCRFGIHSKFFVFKNQKTSERRYDILGGLSEKKFEYQNGFGKRSRLGFTFEKRIRRRRIDIVKRNLVRDEIQKKG